MGGLWRNPPFSIESLTYQVVPEVGGRTLWADLQAAYDDLSEPLKQLLTSVSAVYDGNAENYGGRPDRQPLTETIKHPVVRTHRHTGRKGPDPLRRRRIDRTAARLVAVHGRVGPNVRPGRAGTGH